MTEKGYGGGLVSWVRSSYSGKKYLISTAQEIGKDYWSATVLRVFWGFIPNFFKPVLSVIRNNQKDAHEAHQWIKEVVRGYPEMAWFELAPNPKPAEGWSEDAKKKLDELTKN